MNPLAFEDVTFSYAAPVLEGISFAVPAGAVTALMGPSGCGKSTLVLLALGLLAPEVGDVRHAGPPPAPVFQDPLLLPWRTALANVSFGLRAVCASRAERRARAAATLEAVGIHGPALTQYPHQLSGGMRQRVALARALALEPELLLLDEPFRALDLGLARRMHGLVREQVEARGATALVVTHDAREVALIAERVVVLTGAPGRVALVRDLPGRPAERSDVEVAALTGDLEALR